MSNELKVGYRAVGGPQMRYADSDGSASQHLVLTSPWPGSLHAFAPIWPRLSGIARLLAIDLPGFGPGPAGRVDGQGAVEGCDSLLAAACPHLGHGQILEGGGQREPSLAGFQDADGPLSPLASAMRTSCGSSAGSSGESEQR
jgi:pimeloyl-ACP methyl ester carboxylesterase